MPLESLNDNFRGALLLIAVRLNYLYKDETSDYEPDV